MKSTFFRRLIVILSIIAILTGCGSTGGINDGESSGEEPTDPTVPEPTFNFQGILYNENGSPFPNVDIFVFSSLYDSITDTEGKFALNVSNDMHTLMGSRPGYVEKYQLIDTSDGADADSKMVLQASLVASKTVLASTGDLSLVTNVYRGHTGKLSIPAQNSGKFWKNDIQVDSIAVSVENINLNMPLPAPLPSASNTDIPLPGGKQTPSVLIAVQPALFRMDTAGTLTFPNPDNLDIVRILRFDPETHQWKTITEISTASIAVNRGGVYGLFFDTPKNGSIRGEADPGSIITVGDESVVVGADGTFFVNEVPVPPEGEVGLLALGVPDSETGVRPVIQTDVAVEENQQTIVDLVPVTVGSLTIESSSDTLVGDGESELQLTVEVKDSGGNPLAGEVMVDFNSTGGVLAQSSVRTNGSVAQTTLKSIKGEKGIVRVTASSGGASASVLITLLSVPKTISLSASQISVKSDNSDSSTITATVLNSENAPFANINVSFSVDSGMITVADDDAEGDEQVNTTVQTDSSGKAQIMFSAGPGTEGKTNRVAGITAEVSGLDPVVVPIQVTGTTVEIDNDKTNLDIAGENSATLTVTVRDAGLNPIFSAPVQFSATPEGSLSWAAAEEQYAGFKTDLTGKLVVKISGEAVAEEAVLKVSALGDQKSQTYKVSSSNLLFSIISPDEDPVSLATNTELAVVVQAPFHSKVRFSTSFGEWENGEKVLDVDVVNKKATAKLRSAQAGIASVQVFDADDPGTSDSLRVAVAAPSSEADNISLQTSIGVVAPSTGDIQNTVTLRATVINANRQVVADAPVLFSLSNTTGGGEYLSPVIAYTNSQGIALSTFFSGSLPSSAEGVQVTAEVVGMSNVVPSTRPIVIGGTAGSVVISVSTKVLVDDEDTTYTLPGTVVVADANGNPVSGAQVTLGAWPFEYATGYWVESEGDCIPSYDETKANEDVNRNLILDPGEDLDGDGELTPPNSAAGTIRAIKSDDADDTDGAAVGTTDETGTVKFELLYPKTSAAWILEELTAKALVAGSETQSTYTFTLMPSTADIIPPCPLQDSPYNRRLPNGSINLTTDKTVLTANGQSTATLSAVVYKFNGQPAPDGTTVVFTITQGGGGFPAETTATATTVNGTASVTYTAPKGVSNGTSVSVEVSASGYDTTVENNLIQLDQGEISISSSGAEALLDGKPVVVADGASVLELTADLFNSDGSKLVTAEDERIDWVLAAVTSGIENTGGLNSTANLKAATFTATGTTKLKYVAGVISSDQDPAEVQVTATIKSTGASASINIILKRDGVANITLALEPENQDLVASVPITIKAEVKDQSNIAVKRGELITFSTDDIGVFLTSDGQQDEVTLETLGDDGVIILQLLVADVQEDNTVTVKARSLSGSAEGVLNLTFSVAPPVPEPSRIEVKLEYPEPATIDVIGGPTGRTQSEIRFSVYDNTGKLVTGSFPINFSIVQGPGGGEKLTTSVSSTIGDGDAIAILQSGLRPGAVYVKATYSGENGTIESVKNAVVQIQGGMPAAENFTLIHDADWASSQRVFTANVRDIFGDSVPDNLLVKFNTTSGFLSSSQGLTQGGTVETVLNSAQSVDQYLVTAATDGAYTTKVSSMAVLYRTSDPEFPILYAGTTGSGIYKSTDGGSSWSNIAGLNSGSSSPGQKWIEPYINDVAVDPDNASLIFAGTGYSGKGRMDSAVTNLFISRDSGNTWTSAAGLPADANIPVQTVNCEAGGDHVWVGTQGRGIYISSDNGATFQFQGLASKQVNDIIHVAGSGGSAVLYAGTDDGVYKSINGGTTWSVSGSLSDAVNVLAFYRKSGDEAKSIIYAGTEESGAFYSDSSGESWKAMPSTGRLLVVGEPQPGENNSKEDEVDMIDVKVFSGASTETWTVICKEKNVIGGVDVNVYRVIGSNSGEQADYIVNTQDPNKYDKLPGIIEFKLTGIGEVGDFFTFDIVKDEAKTITSLLVDEGNDRLYAATLYDGFIHDIGSLYSFKLGPNGSVESGNWTLAIDGLPKFADPYDETVVPQYALAPIPSIDGNKGTPKAILIGGEKVTVYKSSSGLANGTPLWQPSMTNIENRIMTRSIVGGDTAAP